MSTAVGTDLVVEAIGLTKRYGDHTAVDQVDLAVPAGTIHGLVGPNGAGKTSLLAMLFGLLLPDSGELRLFGRDRDATGAAWLDRVGGFVEAPHFYPYLTGRRNLEILCSLDGGDAPRLVGDLLQRVGLGEVADVRAGSYSLGMRQRLGLAAALLRQPALLILDEPASGLDPTAVRDLEALLRDFARQGSTVIFSSHDMARLEDACDTFTVLRRGQVVFAGDLAELRRQAPAPTWLLRTSDDAAATGLVRDAELAATPHDDEPGLVVSATQHELDTLVLALGRSGIAVRGLAMTMTPLESLYFQLTDPATQ